MMLLQPTLQAQPQISSYQINHNVTSAIILIEKYKCFDQIIPS